MAINLKQLADFLAEANRNTYAAKSGQAESSRSGSTDLKYAAGDWLFHDSYFGSETFLGEEVVYCQGEPVWGMNYYGTITDKNFIIAEVYDFLRQALLADPGGLIPVRGPKVFASGKYEYRNEVSGTLERFVGREEMSAGGKKVYEAIYHGGSVTGKD